MKLVVVESPYQSDDGNPVEFIEYARACLAFCLRHGAAPFASHLLYTQPGVLDDQIQDERRLGMEAGFLWANHASERWVFTDFGITEGMERGIRLGETLRQKIERIELGPDWQEKWLGPTKTRNFGRCSCDG
jgi:hypothetical protein